MRVDVVDAWDPPVCGVGFACVRAFSTHTTCHHHHTTPHHRACVRVFSTHTTRHHHTTPTNPPTRHATTPQHPPIQDLGDDSLLPLFKKELYGSPHFAFRYPKDAPPPVSTTTAAAASEGEWVAGLCCVWRGSIDRNATTAAASEGKWVSAVCGVVRAIETRPPRRRRRRPPRVSKWVGGCVVLCGSLLCGLV